MKPTVDELLAAMPSPCDNPTPVVYWNEPSQSWFCPGGCVCGFRIKDHSTKNGTEER